MKTILITGASGNLGKASVEKFTTAGYKVITTVTPGKTLGFNSKTNVISYEADLTDERSAEKTIQEIITTHKTIDAALLLVGGFAMGSIKDTDSSLLKKMFTLNFDTTYFVARPVFQQMLTQPGGGKIIMIGSRPALNAVEGKNKIAYTLSKSLIFKLADLINAEGAGKNVTASVIVPSTIDTEDNRRSMPNADFDTWVKPEEIAEAMAFLCAETSTPLRETVLNLYGRA